jgi:cysteinyl-tRNA synthetase
MSKSLGNFITIRSLLDRPTDPMAVRLFVLQAQYRTPIDFTDEAITAAENAWNTLKEGLVFGYQYGMQLLGWTENGNDLDTDTVQRFQAAVDDDFNFPGGLAILFELAKDLRRERNIFVHQGKTETTETSSQHLERQWRTLVSLTQVLGLEFKPITETGTGTVGLGDAQIEAMIQERQAARKAKNFVEGDRIRNQLQAEGITLIDSPDGTRWHRN